MAIERNPLLKGRISSVDTYQSPQPGRDFQPKLPSLDPKVHRTRLLKQLDGILQEVQSRSKNARDEAASREIIAVRPTTGFQLAADQLDNRDAWLIGEIPESGMVLLDVKDAELNYLHKKIDAYADDTKVKIKENKDGSPKLDAKGSPIVSRANEKAIAPIDSISLASLSDIQGERLSQEKLVEGRPYWFEVLCCGGYRRNPTLTASSRGQVVRQLFKLGFNQQLDEFIGPEQVYFFVRATIQQMEALFVSTDCIYRVELAPPPIRDLRLLKNVSLRDVKDFKLLPPDEGAPAVVVLDTGIATGNPLLKTAILSATTACPEIPSPEDTHDHGTQMAGLALHRDIGAAIEHGVAQAPHWLQSVRLLVSPSTGTASDENDENWPTLTQDAIRSAENSDVSSRNRVFSLAVTRTMQDPPFDGPIPTLWGHAIDQLAFEGNGRLIVVSAGNARESQWLTLAGEYPQLQLSEKIHEPAQASNVLTVGAYTKRSELPRDSCYAEYRAVAESGGISPFTSVGPAGKEWPIKPDVVMEGGNLAISGKLYDSGVETLSALTTQKTQIAGRPLALINMTSEAAARASHLAAHIWSLEPNLRPETVRGLIVHSSSWTPTMQEQFSNLNDRLLACGYGVPNERIASECARNLATIVVEDVMPNAVMEEEPKKNVPKRSATKRTEQKARRKVKYYRVPIPESLLSDADPEVELRVTLSYFVEPNSFGRQVFHGLDLKWDMQGPQESEDEFFQRINKLKRPVDLNGKRAKGSDKESFDWEIGIRQRSRSTVQSDRWCGKMSALVGNKIIAVVPVLGWWDKRPNLKTQEMRFSLIVSIFGPGVYAVIKQRVEAAAVIGIGTRIEI
jgi:hypothetical protein